MFLKYRNILKDCISGQNLSKMLKGVLFGNVAGPQSVTLSKKKKKKKKIKNSKTSVCKLCG